MKTPALVFLIVAVATVAAGCSCGTAASCTSMGVDLLTPGHLPSLLMDVTADPPCTTQLIGDGGSAQVMVTTESATQGAVCVLHGHLTDGRVVTATVTWQQATGDSCCNGWAASGGQFMLSDAGVGGG